jgi:hypothetical protein
MRQVAREHWVPFGLTVLCIAVFFAIFVPPTLRDAGNLSFSTNSDLQSYFLPKYAFGSEEFLRGRLPVWNLYEYGGLPFIATVQPAVFYPPKALLFAVLPPSVAHWVFLVGHYVLTAWAFALFGRELGLRREAAFVGAAAFLFSTPVLMGNYHPTRIASLSWMPFIFLFMHRILKGGGFTAFASLAAALSMQLHAGYPEFTLDTALFVPAFVIASWIAGLPERPRWSAPLWIGGAFALAGLIAAVLMLPLAEAGIEAKRAAIAGGAEHMQGSKGERTFSDFLLPLSLLVPGLAAFTLLSVTSRKAWPAAATVATCLALVLGGAYWVLLLPGFSMIRFPYTAVLVTMFFPAWGAAAGADLFLRSPEASARRRRALIAAVLCVCAGLGVYYVFRIVALVNGEKSHYQSVTSVVLALVGLAVIAASALTLSRGAWGSRLFSLGAVVLVLAQFSVFPFNALTAPYERPGEHGEIKRLLGKRPPPAGRALSLHDLLHGYNLTDRMRSVLGIEESFLPWRFRQIREKVRLIQVLGYLEIAVVARMPGFLSAMDLEYIAVKPQEASLFEALGMVPVARDERAVLLHNPARMGTAWVNYGVRHLPDDEAAFQHVTGKDFDPHVEVIVTDRLKHSYPERAAHRATPPRALRRPTPTVLEIDVDLPRPGVLVVSEAAYPGWSVTVDDQPAEWVRADFVLRGVELGQGSHRVRFVYSSPALRWGIVLSLAGVALLLAAFGIGYARARRRE